MTKLLKIAAAVSACLPLLAVAGNAISFDPDGAGSAFGATQIDLLDWAVGNALSVGGAGLQPGVNPTTQLLYQANLSITSLNGQVKSTSGAGGASFLTAVAGFQETPTLSIIPSVGAFANFTLASAPVLSSTNFFYIYASATAQGNNLTGAGFASTGSNTLIMSGHITKVVNSNFFTDGSTGLFDQFGADNYAGKQTIIGSGATNINVTIDSADQSYFPGLTISGLAFSFFNNSQVTPFNQADPSKNFSTNGIADANYAANLSTVNGIRTGTSSQDFQFQADANQSFLVPEPGSLALVGVALAGLGLASRRRKN